MKLKMTLLSIGLGILLVGCGTQSTTSSPSSESIEPKEEKVDYMDEATKNIEANHFYQAQDALKKIQETGSVEDKEKAEHTLNQIELYQTAEDNLSDHRFEVAQDNLDKIIEDDQGLAIMKDKASELKKKVSRQEDEKEKLDKASKEKQKTKKSNQTKKDNTARWNSEKSSELSHFMVSWGNQMGQHYTELSPSSMTPWGNVGDIISGHNQGMTTTYNGQNFSAVWSSTGEGSGYNVVAAYTDASDTTQDRRGSQLGHLYLFVIINGQPHVLITEQNQGNTENRLYFKDTANTSLRNGFSSIVQK